MWSSMFPHNHHYNHNFARLINKKSNEVIYLPQMPMSVYFIKKKSEKPRDELKIQQAFLRFHKFN